MSQTVNIGIIGDYDANRISHTLTNAAIEHAVQKLSVRANVTWLPTPSFLLKAAKKKLERYDAVWASPGSPYESMEGALKGIRLAREMNIPFIGT